MGFIKFSGLWLMVVLMIVALLSACSTTPRQQIVDAPEETFDALPNPYLTHQKTPSSQAQADFELALQAMQSQDWQTAKTLLERMTQTYPSLSGPYVNLGLVHRQLHQQDKAIEAFTLAIAVNSLNSEAYNQLAILHREQGQFALAEQSYLQALEVWPHNPVVHRNLGILYDLYMGRFDDALRHYRLSQKVATEPERRVTGWIVDLQRRISAEQAAAR